MSKKTTTAAAVASATAAATTTTTTTANAAPVFAKISPADSVAIAAALIKQHGTIAAIRANAYAALMSEHGKDNVKSILKDAAAIRGRELDALATALNSKVFTFDGITAAVFAAVAKCPEYAALCAAARRAYSGTPAEIAAAVIKDYFTAVDTDGRPLCRVGYINAAAVEIYAVWERKALTHTNAVSILKTSLDNMKRAAAAAARFGRDDAAAVRNNTQTTGLIIAVYAAALDDTQHATIGTRRDNSKDERTRNAAAALMGKTLPVGCVPVSVYNAALNGNENAAAALDAARDAAKDAAAARAAKPAKK